MSMNTICAGIPRMELLLFVSAACALFHGLSVLEAFSAPLIHRVVCAQLLQAGR